MWLYTYNYTPEDAWTLLINTINNSIRIMIIPGTLFVTEICHKSC